MGNMLMGAFENPRQADAALRELESRGYTPQDISALSKISKYDEQGYDSGGSNVAASAGSGAVTGGVLGGLAGLLAGVGIIPAIAGFFIGGPIAAAIGLAGAAATTATGALTGGAVGGLIGALMGMGVPRDTATSYDTVVNNGGVILGLSGHDEITDEARQILESNGARDMQTIETTQAEATAPGTTSRMSEDTHVREDAAMATETTRTETTRHVPNRAQPAFGETREAGAERNDPAARLKDDVNDTTLRDGSSAQDRPARDAGAMREERRDTLRQEDL